MNSSFRLDRIRRLFATAMIAVLIALAPTLRAQNAPNNQYFGLVVIGGGWNLVFALVNTGATTVNNTLSLRGQDGRPLNVRIGGVVASTFSLEPLPPGSVRRLVAEPLDVTDPIQFGWAKYENIGGNVTLTATYQLRQEGVLRTLVGVPSTPLVTAATIPVYNDLAAGRFLAFAVANPNASPISLRLTTLNENGTIKDGPITPPQLVVPPNGQVVIFLHEILPSLATFTGSMVLSTQGSQGRFVVAALLQNQNLLIAAPVIPE